MKDWDAIVNEWFYLFHQDFDELTPELQEIVYRSFYTHVYKDIFYLIGDHASTEDMIQEAFFKIISIVHKHQVSNYPAWLRHVTRNLTLDMMRKNKKERQMTDLSVVSSIESNIDLAVQQISVAIQVEETIRDELLLQAINELKPEYRTIITLFYIHELSYKEVAGLLDLSEHAVSQKLARARKKLLYQFQRKWDDPNE
ncbi:RNA polymerase sigma factor [Paenibacillus sp. FA6]|uniref:RNA polymerase sigma factor n=1 Tax=Paenibacillus sp. FA6 TaxID=3413029 RepID=UPI003F65DCE5